MSVKISESENINAVQLTEQGSNPSTPASGFQLLYVKTSGLYLRASDGTVYGPILGAFAELAETTTPSAPAANHARLYAADDGGDTRLYVIDSGSTVRKIPNTFTELTDVPAAYTGYANAALRVLGDESALDFAYRSETHTSVGNVGSGEDNLHSATLTGLLAFDVNGAVIHFVAGGTFANTANNKRIRVKLGSTTMLDTGALATTTAQSWMIEGWVTRTGASAERYLVKFLTSDTGIAPKVAYGTASEDTTASITLQFTGEATSNNDVTQEWLLVEQM